jgi:hypothetical protein
VLVGWFREKSPVRVFRQGWCDDTARFQPQAIAATWPQLRELMEGGDAAPDHAVIALARPGDPLLSPEAREQLWRAFRVPVFEQIVGPRGRLLAAECEAHEGLHIAWGDFSVRNFALEASPCPCGRATPRLVPLRTRELVRAVAAYAR